MNPLLIGSLLVDPPLVQAPMAGLSDYDFRRTLRRLGGAGLLTTEMVSARGFLYAAARGEALPERLWGVIDEPRPLAVQIWDSDPDSLAAVGDRLANEFRVSVIDINFGCPARDVADKGRSGAYLLRWPQRIGDLVARVAAACAPVPVTAKIRLGSTRDTINAIDVAQAVEGAGGAGLTVHGRTAAEMFRGRADWNEIARIKPHLRRIPLIGNGDISTPQAAAEAMSRYGVDGVMIGRAGLSRPWLFRQAAAAILGQPAPPDPSPAEQRDLLLDHHRSMVARFGPEQGTVLMRKYACFYAHGRPGGRQFRARLSQVASPDQFTAAVEGLFSDLAVGGR